MWKAIGASVQGSAHVRNGIPCQDAHRFSLLPGDRLVAAAADGAGSAERADEGAEMAVETAHLWLNSLPKSLSDDDPRVRGFLLQSLEHALGTLERQAEAEGVPLKSYACTLLVAVATPDFIAAAQIGDGAIIARSQSGEIVAITMPENGEHANETIFLTSDRALESAQFVLWPGEATHFALFTDGLQRLALKLPEAVPHAPFFDPLFDFVSKADSSSQVQAQLENFLRSGKVTDRTDDDVTLLLASRT